jgi:hypothetical protein
MPVNFLKAGAEEVTSIVTSSDCENTEWENWLNKNSPDSSNNWSELSDEEWHNWVDKSCMDFSEESCKNSEKSINSGKLDIDKNDFSGENWDNPNYDSILKALKNRVIKTEYPAVLRQYIPFSIYCNKKGDYTIKIVGDNNYEVELYRCFRNIWIGRMCRSGIFNIVVMNDGKVLKKRKVYVNSWNNEYLQLEDLKIDDGENTHVRAKLETDRPCGFDEEEDEIMKFVIGEPGVWSRTIKNYGEQIREENGYYEIDEDSENFKFNNGTYSVGAFVKGRHSIEYEDVKFMNYRKSGLEGLKLKLEVTKTDSSKIKDGKYPVGSKFTFKLIVEGISDEDKEKLEISFFRDNEQRQDVKVKGYRDFKEDSEANILQWSPAKSGKYVITARVRQKGGHNLPNSYEAHAAYPVEIYSDDVGNIEIKNVYIGNCWKLCGEEISKADVISHEMNFIDICADYKNNKKCGKNKLMYKAYAVHDGYYRILGEYSKANVIPFYPKSYGKYKIVILVKHVNSGSYEAKRTFDINVRKAW